MSSPHDHRSLTKVLYSKDPVDRYIFDHSLRYTAEQQELLESIKDVPGQRSSFNWSSKHRKLFCHSRKGSAMVGIHGWSTALSTAASTNERKTSQWVTISAVTTHFLHTLAFIHVRLLCLPKEWSIESHSNISDIAWRYSCVYLCLCFSWNWYIHGIHVVGYCLSLTIGRSTDYLRYYGWICSTRHLDESRCSGEDRSTNSTSSRDIERVTQGQRTEFVRFHLPGRGQTQLSSVLRALITVASSEWPSCHR